MNISGWIKQSLMDYPGKIASVIFTQGCNFRCPYCHNPELIPKGKGRIDENEVLAHLRKTQMLLDGIVISGGEPTMQSDLTDFIREIKSLGLAVKLDTNGSQSNRLEQLLAEGLVDYIAMDIKSELCPADYSKNSGIPVSTPCLNEIRRSIQLLIRSGVEHEFRTTVCRELISMENLHRILAEMTGAKRYFIQHYRPAEKQTTMRFSAYSNEEIAGWLAIANQQLDVAIRD
ncbi:anaerobic ribonucleoside-triphosphate reductase activating protein [Sunxiuqinia elliptica]|uniref:Pyruvate formate lyase activating enzyme n=1 Tax=Sunxiuqinia elliptica TaxID=655355 RepID=A0A1I2H4G8_9BACT|nr:anaerobic ribonucleoside-triphosphate reductase activating protein [Sunxiuqinia elliptica]SFF23696.1 pyruvate formate lyase activating enzyme [Sunxiuqinia elliptica]